MVTKEQIETARKVLTELYDLLMTLQTTVERALQIYEFGIECDDCPTFQNRLSPVLTHYTTQKEMLITKFKELP